MAKRKQGARAQSVAAPAKRPASAVRDVCRRPDTFQAWADAEGWHVRDRFGRVRVMSAERFFAEFMEPLEREP